MIQSMTGFGKAIEDFDNSSVEVEVRSVNSRFLDLSVRLPKNLSDKEIEIRNLIKKRVKRGKLSLNIFVKQDGLENNGSILNEKSLENTVKLLTQIKNIAGLNNDITLNDILAFQNAIFSENLEESEEEFKTVKKTVIKAIDELVKMRRAEGKILNEDLKLRIERINEIVDEIMNSAPETVNKYFKKLKDRAKELIENISDFDDRLKIELALLAEKYDITEECIRLKSHIQQFISTIENDDEAGRKLSFIVQEMNRESNTINNKSVSIDISKRGILIKEELEKIREQIQNIE